MSIIGKLFGTENKKSDMNESSAIESDFMLKEYNLSSVSSLIAQLNGQNGITQFDYNANLKDAYFSNPVVYFCVNLIATLATQPRWELYVDGKEVTNITSTEYGKALFAFIQRPNEKQTLRDFISNYIIHDYLAGETFMYRYPNNKALNRGNGKVILLEPSNMEIKDDKYIFTNKDNKRMEIPLVNSDKTKDILHRASWHPTSNRGFSSLTPAWIAIQNMNAALQWNASTLKNSARLSMVAIQKESTIPNTKQTLTPEQQKRLQEDLSRFASPQGRGKPFVLSGDWDIKELGQSNADLEFIKGLESMSRLIALSFGVDPILLSLPGDSTYSNKKEANAAVFKMVVLPKLEMMKDDITNWFSELYGIDKQVEIRLNMDDVVCLESDREKLWSRQKDAVDILTIDERRLLLGFEPLPNKAGEVLSKPIAKEPQS